MGSVGLKKETEGFEEVEKTKDEQNHIFERRNQLQKIQED
jgi:hypothetical protein